MTIGLCTLEFHLPGCHSLKEKRMFLRRLRDRLGNRYNVATSEIDHQDLWQRSVVGIVSIATRREVLDRQFQKILREVERNQEGELITFHVEFL